MKRNFLLLFPLLSTACAFVGEPPVSSAILVKDIQVVQQTTDYTCGPASASGLLKYYGIQVGEINLAKEMKTNPDIGTTPENMAKSLESKGLKVTWGENGSVDLLKDNLRKGIPTLVEWIDWGGHWVVVVGLDDKGTPAIEDDEIILADPYDRIDGKPDGLTYFNLERFDSMWFDALYFGKLMKRVYIFINGTGNSSK